MARATRTDSGACSTAVALSPPSATSRAQALPPMLITDEVWSEAAWTTTDGCAAAIASSAARSTKRSKWRAENRTGRRNIATRALAAVSSQASRSALRPAMRTVVGSAAVAARSQAM
jgi:hypothetical protein